MMEPLVYAAASNDLDSIHRLLEQERARNPQLSQTTSFPRFGMHDACIAAAKHNQIGALSILLDNGAFITQDAVGAALSGKCKEVFQFLVDRGWDINSNMGHSGSPLLMSVRSGDEQMVQFLISLGADPNAHRSIGGQTALELAAYGASMPIIEALVEAGANLKGRSALVKAAGEGRTDVVVYLLDRGADINEIPDNENINDNYRANGLMNALCQAAWKGQANVVRLLLGRGADAEIKDTKGRSALELARMEGNEYCVELLQAHVN